MEIALCGYAGAWRLDAAPDSQDCVNAWVQSREQLEGLAAGVDPILFPEELPSLLQEWENLGELQGWHYRHSGGCCSGSLSIIHLSDGWWRVNLEPGFQLDDEIWEEAQRGDFHNFSRRRFHWVQDDVRFWPALPSLEGMSLDDIFRRVDESQRGILPFVEADSHFRALRLEEEGRTCTCYMCNHGARARLAREPEWIGYSTKQMPRAVGFYCENCAWEAVFGD